MDLPPQQAGERKTGRAASGARVIGLGQAAAGDDAVGFEVIDRIRRLRPPPGIELFAAREPTALLALLETKNRVILVDAVVGHFSAGKVIELQGEALAAAAYPAGEPRPVSTHGVGLRQAIELARILAGGAAVPDIALVGVAIALPRRYSTGLSPEVRAAVPLAVRVVLARARSSID
jgi:hydrogenase maturation protease